MYKNLYTLIDNFYIYFLLFYFLEGFQTRVGDSDNDNFLRFFAFFRELVFFSFGGEDSL
jgi:hypothetical protein